MSQVIDRGTVGTAPDTTRPSRFEELTYLFFVLWTLIGPLAGGLMADAVVARFTDRARAMAIGVAVPLAMWSVSTLAIHLAWTVLWPPELWIGQIVMAVLAGLGLAVISHPPSLPNGMG